MERERLQRIVVGIDGSAGGLEAARQAGALSGPESTIELVTVVHDGKVDPTIRLEAESELAGSSARVVTRVVSGHPAWKILLAEASGADLLVVGRHPHSRAAGIVARRTTTELIHHANLPLLVAITPDSGKFPERILVAAGGVGHPERAVSMAATIAERAGSQVEIIRVDWAHGVKPAPVRDAVRELALATGSPPDEWTVGGKPHREIVEAAKQDSASLIVMASRGLTGPAALRSVSERVAHTAPCSVLVMHTNGTKE